MTTKIYYRGTEDYSLNCEWLTTNYQQEGNNIFWHYPPSIITNQGAQSFSKKSYDGKTITWYSMSGSSEQRNSFSDGSNGSETFTYCWIIFA